MKIIRSIFEGGIAWLVLGSVLLLGMFLFVELSFAETDLTNRAVPMVEPVQPREVGLMLSNADLSLYQWLSSPALMSFSLTGIILLWSLYYHKQPSFK